MRGTADLLPCHSTPPGITPAHAGNSPPAAHKRCRPRDHPRTCGEQLSVFFWSMSLTGSPPHMRGTEFRVIQKLAILRITPAHAGNSLHSSSRSQAHGDHPRTCGEQAKSVIRSFWIQGSPPHMRGTDETPHAPHMVVGITPAHAGNSE